MGFLHGPAQAMDAISGLQTYATYCAPRPMQQLAAAALQSQEGADWLAEARLLYERAGREAAAAVEVPAPESGTFLLFDTARFCATAIPEHCSGAVRVQAWS